MTIGQPVCRQKSMTRRKGANRDGDGRQGMQTVTSYPVGFGGSMELLKLEGPVVMVGMRHTGNRGASCGAGDR